MRILFDNLIFDATLTADSVDANYPLTNLQNESCKKIYKATATSVVITVTLKAVSTVNCFYFGYTNATAVTLALYNASDVLLKTVTLNASHGGATFATTYTVSYAKLTLAGADIIYMGIIGIGNNYKMPDPYNDVILKPIDNSKRKYSGDGQKYVNYVNILHQMHITYKMKTLDIYTAVMAKWEVLRHSAWVEPYEENTGIINPMFCEITMDDSPEQSDRLYTWKHNYREVR